MLSIHDQQLVYRLWYQYKLEEDIHKEKVQQKDTSSSSSEDCPYSDKVLLQLNEDMIDDPSVYDRLESNEPEAKPYFTAS